MERKNMLYQALYVASVIFVFGCQGAEDLEEPGRLAASSSVSGGLLNFGIPYKEVNKTVAERFWTSYRNSKGFVLKSGTSDLEPPAQYNPGFQQVKVGSQLQGELKKLIKNFESVGSTWLKTRCLAVDMDQATGTPKKLSFAYAKREMPGEQGIPSVSIDAYYRQLGSSNYVCGYDTYDPDTYSPIPGPSEQEILNRGEFKISYRNPSDESTSQTFRAHRIATEDGGAYIEVASGLDLIIGGNLYESQAGPIGSASINFIVAGNFVFPAATHAVSKGFAVPVMEFDPDTLKPIAFYDFGLLVLENLPDSEVFLVTMVNEDIQNLWRAGKTQTLGTLWNMLPERAHDYVKQGNIPSKTKYWNYDQIPAGSIHFVANAAWHDPAFAPDRAVIVHGFTKTELRDLYLTNNVWINSYDRIISLDDKKNKEAYVRLQQLKNNQACVPIKEIAHYPDGAFMSHEIIVGGQVGRSKVLSKPRFYLQTHRERQCLLKIAS